MKIFVLITLLIIKLYPALNAQNTGMFLIPRQIHIGDSAVLVMPLPAVSQDRADIILTPESNNFPEDEDIDFHRIILEQRVIGSRLMIEFSVFVPGYIEFPVIEIGGQRFEGIYITVNSIIDSRMPPILSAPASALTMPGTAFLLYGSISALVITILLTIWFFLKGRKILDRLIIKWKCYRLFNSMKKSEKHLRRAIIKGADKREILDRLSDEFRDFLSVLTENNCRAMTASELKKIPELPGVQQESMEFISQFFTICDELRFSGIEVKTNDIIKLLDDLRGFIGLLEKAASEKKSQIKEEEEAA